MCVLDKAAAFPFKSGETGNLAKRLALHNARWERRYDAWLRHHPIPLWARDVILSPEDRGWMNTFLPADDYWRDLRLLAEACLAVEDIPTCLFGEGPLSLADLWATLEEGVVSKVTFDLAELPRLFCNLSSPARMGTSSGRYPLQLELLQRVLRRSSRPVRVLDIGCGIGVGTLEIADALKCVCDVERVLGITTEGLDVWMATTRCVPHHLPSQRALESYSLALPVGFARGTAESFGELCESADAITCNGLIGGRFFNRQEQYTAFLASCGASLKKGGGVFCSCCFHEGTRADVQRFMSFASSQGWSIQGTWREFLMTKLD